MQVNRSPGAAPRVGRLSLLYCEQCGTPLTPPNATETLLAKLTQLARFGLSAGDRPILSPAPPRRRKRVALESE